jgi:hypothetical protein
MTMAADIFTRPLTSLSLKQRQMHHQSRLDRLHRGYSPSQLLKVPSLPPCPALSSAIRR